MKLSSFSWNFGDSLSLSNFSFVLSQGHIFSSPGTYIVTAVIDYGNFTDTATRVITVYPSVTIPEIFGADTTLCMGDTLQKSVYVPCASYLWSDIGNGWNGHNLKGTAVPVAPIISWRINRK